MDLLVAVPVRLLPAFPLFDFRGVLELLFGDVHTVCAELLIVVQHRPGNRIMVRADAEKAPETQDRVGDAAAGFIDHKALDLPDALTVRVIDRSSFNPIACDQRGCGSVLRYWWALYGGHHGIVSLDCQPPVAHRKTGASARIADRWPRSLALCCKRLRCHRARCIDSRQRWEALVNSTVSAPQVRAAKDISALLTDSSAIQSNHHLNPPLASLTATGDVR